MAHFNKKPSNQTFGTSDFQEEAQESVSFRATSNADPAKDVPVDFDGHDPEETTPKAGDERAADGLPHADCPLQKVSRTERVGEDLPQKQTIVNHVSGTAVSRACIHR